ncbi:hypothetical protein PUN28_008315 [Cardiocondyla obscurior]|uniref:Uncharacterized protein n=1 Tax=Cardiocondyla obscurior TaxID=286306 RepID=A0AAW2G026_9HYME
MPFHNLHYVSFVLNYLFLLFAFNISNCCLTEKIKSKHYSVIRYTILYYIYIFKFTFNVILWFRRITEDYICIVFKNHLSIFYSFYFCIWTFYYSL